MMKRYLLLISALALSLAQGHAFTQGSAFASPQPGRAQPVKANPNKETSPLTPPMIDQQQPRRITWSSLAMVGHVIDNHAIPLPPVPVRTPDSAKLSPLEVWCLVRIEKWYSKALSRKCPFLRRRMTDFMDTLEMMVRISVIRREKIDLAGPPVSLRGDERTKQKVKHLDMNALAAIIRRDWREDSQKGYYITGRLTPAIYRDDCFFDGPDPDMPVRGLRKFLNAASQLFDPKESVCELRSLEIQGDVIVADWKMNGVLRLPWRPRLPQVLGQTIYHFDEDGLIERHEETWDLSAVEAFLKTAWFDFQFQAANTHNEKLQEAEVYE